MLYPQFENRDGEQERPKPMADGLRIPALGLIFTDGDGNKLKDGTLVRDVPDEIHAFIAVCEQHLPEMHEVLKRLENSASLNIFFRYISDIRHEKKLKKIEEEREKEKKQELLDSDSGESKSASDGLSPALGSSWSEKDIFDAFLFYMDAEILARIDGQRTCCDLMSPNSYEFESYFIGNDQTSLSLRSYCLYRYLERVGVQLGRDKIFELCQQVEECLMKDFFHFSFDELNRAGKNRSQCYERFTFRLNEHVRFVSDHYFFEKRETIVRLEKLRIKKLKDRHADDKSAYVLEQLVDYDKSSYTYFVEFFGSFYPKNALEDKLQAIDIIHWQPDLSVTDVINWKAVEDSVVAGEDENKPVTEVKDSENDENTQGLMNNVDNSPKNDDAKSDASSEFVFGWGEEKAASEISDDENAGGNELEGMEAKSEENALDAACADDLVKAEDERAAKRQKID